MVASRRDPAFVPVRVWSVKWKRSGTARIRKPQGCP